MEVLIIIPVYDVAILNLIEFWTVSKGVLWRPDIIFRLGLDGYTLYLKNK